MNELKVHRPFLFKNYRQDSNYLLLFDLFLFLFFPNSLFWLSLFDFLEIACKRLKSSSLSESFSFLSIIFCFIFDLSLLIFFNNFDDISLCTSYKSTIIHKKNEHRILKLIQFVGNQFMTRYRNQ